MKWKLIAPLLLVIVGCTSTSETKKPLVVKENRVAITSHDQLPEKPQFPIAKDHGKFIDTLGKTFLYGGEDFANHFDFTDCSLKQEQFHFGIGREAFPALLKPEFIPVHQVHDSCYDDDTRFLYLEKDGVKKAYSIPDLTRCEVVNDEINGEPIMAAYCVLADLGAIYTRNYKGKPFTFALSGYTYHDDAVWNGMDGFVLWDRETESLWWPLTGDAVSGLMKGTRLEEFEQTAWKEVVWKDIKENHADAMVMKCDQDFERPKTWPKYAQADLSNKQ